MKTMKKLINKLAASVLAVSLFSTVFAQTAPSPSYWEKINESAIVSTGTRWIVPKSYTTFKLNPAALRTHLQSATRKNNPSGIPVYISLPGTDGNFHKYRVFENTTMHADLAAQFPEIRSYDGIATDHSGEVVKFDLTPQGFHAMILSPTGATVFIDPYSFGGGDIENYVVYSKNDFVTDKQFQCSLASAESLIDTEDQEIIGKAFGTCELRTYRLAVSATAEYTIFHGGTVTLALAAQVTTMNRVNGVYERDMAITMVIVPNNNLIIYTSPGSDPFSNGNPNSMITQNQTNTNSVIGSANYDIGHVFGTNSGGLAGLGVVCTNGKARGVTGSSAPVSDPFDIDYVAHEMGHQFNANHTQNNNCNRNNATAVEPGSGSTIMGYAGICAPNVQSNSDDHFHGRSLQEIGTFIISGSHNCPAKTPLSNSAPDITATPGNITIPIRTPFALTAVATDADGDVLTYCWEQMNNQTSTQAPVATSTGGPNFRSYRPSTSPTRYFPNIASQLSNGPFTWEVLPSVSRTMNFRVVVRDNSAGGSCNDHGDITVTTTSTAGPFVVNYPNAAGISWSTNSSQTITWSVANTNVAPVACANVNILLSTDGGVTFTTVLANTPNDGSEVIVVPNTPSTTAVIMVICANGTFFDISNNVFTITDSGCNTPSIPVVGGSTNVCVGGTGTLTISTGTLNDATDWHWYSGSCGGTPIGTGTSVNISGPGTYYVRGEGGCVTPGTCKSVTIQPPLINTNVTTSGLQLTATQSGAAYQWINCNGNVPIAGATAQTYTATANGQYAVEVTLAGSNCSSTSACITINNVGLEDLTATDIMIYPNPAHDFVMVQAGQSVAIDAMFLTDALGRTIQSRYDIQSESIKVDLSNESSGVYFLNFHVAGGYKTFRVVKQ